MGYTGPLADKDRIFTNVYGFQEPWLKAAQDDFRIAHGWDAPVALTGFRWETPDRLVQTATYADGRRITANFGAAP